MHPPLGTEVSPNRSPSVAPRVQRRLCAAWGRVTVEPRRSEEPVDVRHADSVPDVTEGMVRAELDRSPLASSPYAVAVRAPDGSGAEACSGHLGGYLAVTADAVMYAASIAKQVVGLPLAETPGVLDDGTQLDYAWGIRIITHLGRRTVSHGGSWPTWSAKAIRQPDSGLSVAILTTSPDVGEVTAVALGLAGKALRISPGPD
jgi:hypothetical protein